jgi:hypothetical protein
MHNNDDQQYVTKEVLRLELRLLSSQIAQVIKLQEQSLAEQQRTNGTVKNHTTQIARIWAIGTTAWAIVVGFLTWKF